MRTIPVDTSRVQFMAAGGSRPKIKDRDTGELKRADDGRTLYAVPVLAASDGDDGESIRVTVPATDPPVFTMGTPLRFTGLVAIAWRMGDRSGIAYRAESVETAAGAAEGVT